MIIDEIDFDYRNYILNIYYALVAGAFMFKLYIAIVITDKYTANSRSEKNTIRTNDSEVTDYMHTVTS